MSEAHPPQLRKSTKKHGANARPVTDGPTAVTRELFHVWGHPPSSMGGSYARCSAGYNVITVLAFWHPFDEHLAVTLT